MANPNNLVEQTLNKYLLANAPTIELPDGSYFKRENIVLENSPVFSSMLSEDSTMEFPFIVIHQIAGRPSYRTLGQGGSNRLTGIYQLSIYTEKYMGKSYSYSITNALYDYFKRGITVHYDDYTVYVKISDSSVERVSYDDTCMMTPMTVYWYIDYVPDDF